MDSSYIKSNWKSWLFGLLFLAIAAIAIAGLVIAVQAKNKPHQKDTSNIINTNSKPGSVTKPKLGAVLAAVGDTPASGLPYTTVLSTDGITTTTFSGPVVFNSAVTAQTLTTQQQNTAVNLSCTSLIVTTGASIGAGNGASASPGLQVGNSENGATLSVFGDSTFDGTSSFSGAANFAEGATFGKDKIGNPSSFDSSGVLKVATITSPGTDLSKYNYISLKQRLRVSGGAVINADGYLGINETGGSSGTYGTMEVFSVIRPTTGNGEHNGMYIDAGDTTGDVAGGMHLRQYHCDIPVFLEYWDMSPMTTTESTIGYGTENDSLVTGTCAPVT